MFSYGIEVTDDDDRATLTNWCGLGSIVNCCVFNKFHGAAAELTAEATKGSTLVVHSADDGRATLTNWCGFGSIVNGCVFSKRSGAIAAASSAVTHRSRPVRSRTR